MKEGVSNGFDRIAPFYDLLAGIIYGNQIRKSQTYFLHLIPRDAKVLVLGGGTGWIINRILEAQPICKIWYIDSSKGMIIQAKKKRPDHPQVVIVQGTFEEVPAEKFDVIIMPFFLDLFSMNSLRKVLLSVSISTTSSTCWFVTDFVDHGRWWEKILLRGMYGFFDYTCSIEATKLPTWYALMITLDFRLRKTQSFYYGFIESHYYVR